MRSLKRLSPDRGSIGLKASTLAGLLLLAGPLLLAGCGHDRLPVAGPAEFVEGDVRVDHQLRFAPGSDTLAAADRQRLVRFLAGIDPGADGAIEISIGPGGSGQAERLTHLQAILTAEGRGSSGRVHAHPHPDVAVLSVEQDVVLPTRCAGAGLWDSDIADGTEGLPIGCTTSMNLEAMIDDREDLVRGRPLGPAAAAPAAEIARRYLSSRSADRSGGHPDGDDVLPLPDAAYEPGSDAPMSAPPSGDPAVR